MLFNPLGLLGLLGGIANAVSSKPKPGPAAPGQFAQQLDQARQGEVASNLPIHVDPGLDLNLTGDQLERLSAAADKAEAAGIRRALVQIDGQSVVMDVKARTIVRKADGSGPMPGDVDGVVTASALGVGGAEPVKLPAGLPANASVKSLLESMEKTSQDQALKAA